MTVGIARIADGEPTERKRRDGRALLLKGARQLLAEKGYAGMELRDVAERGKAPRGSIYHHFPGGKTQLAAEAAALEGTEIKALIERSLEQRGLAETLTFRAGNARSPLPCATKESTPGTPRPSPASSSPRSRAPCCALAPPVARSRSTRRSAASDMRWTGCSRDSPASH